MFELKSVQDIPRPLDEVFAFFSEAANLESITPGWLQFRIVSPQPIRMAVGARIDYKLRIHGLPLRWTSEITAWEPPHRFVDEQRRGPYRSWLHEHRFVAIDGGTRVEDSVHYEVPGGLLINRFLVAPDLARVFDFRRRRLTELLGGTV